MEKYQVSEFLRQGRLVGREERRMLWMGRRAWAGGAAVGHHSGEVGWEVGCLWESWAVGPRDAEGAGRTLKTGHWVLDLI